MKTATINTSTDIVTVETWLRDPVLCAVNARRTARREGAREWEVAVESGGQVNVLKRGKV